MKDKMMKTRALALVLALAVVLMVSAQNVMALPTEVDPADAIAQVAATAADLLPYAIAAAVAGIVFRLVRKWIR